MLSERPSSTGACGLRVRTVSLPPSGIAWTAFSARLMNTCLSCSASAWSAGSPGVRSSSSTTLPGMLLSISFIVFQSTSLRSVLWNFSEAALGKGRE